MTNQLTSTEPRMGRFLLNLLGILASFAGAFTIKLSIELMYQMGSTGSETGIAIIACIASIFICSLVTRFVILGCRDTQFWQILTWLIGGVTLGFLTPAPEALTGSIFLLLVFVFALALLLGLTYITYTAEHKRRKQTAEKYRKHSGEKGFRIDIEA